MLLLNPMYLKNTLKKKINKYTLSVVTILEDTFKKIVNSKIILTNFRSN